MNQRLKLNAAERAGKASAVRNSDAIPAVAYGPGVDTMSLQLDKKSFQKVWLKSGNTTLVDIKLGDDRFPALIRDTQMHPLKDEVIHVDLYRVNMNKEIEASVPLKFTGVSIAVKDLGGVLVRTIDELEIKALPQDLLHEIEVDISVLTDFEKAIHIKDIKLPKQIEILQDAEEVVALVQPPRSEEEIEQLSEEVTEDVESVEGVTKEEEGAEGEEGTEDEAKTDDQPADDKKAE